MNSDVRQTEGKFSTNWQGPFRMLADAEKKSIQVEYLFGEPVPKTWNMTHLKFYYS